MDKRTFLKTFGLLASGLAIGSLKSCKSAAIATSSQTAFELPALGYDFAALEPHIDTLTMQIHHGKHHAAYVSNFNSALKGSPLEGKTLEEIMANLLPTDTALRNNGGGHYNHSLFWKIIAPGGPNLPEGKLAEAINAQFGSYEQFRAQFTDAAKKVFGSGWTWLATAKGKLAIVSTPNQDNPLMAKVVATQMHPIIGIDVWEHAYYLKYQNRRAEYIEAFFRVLNWKAASAQFAAARL